MFCFLGARLSRSTVNNDGTAQNRTHNRQNQITSITSLTTPTYDANGNMTGDENGKTLVYDAWNRLVDFKNGGTSLEAYAHDALNRRITEDTGTSRALFYTAEWQVIEERTSGVARVSYVWSPVYIDALIVRDRDSDTNGSLDERLYVAHDANWNVSSILNTSAAVQERYVYDPFGAPSFKDAGYGARGSSSFAWIVLHQGGMRSETSSLISFRSRLLGPILGRWNSVDHLAGYRDGPNTYSYLSNAPIVWSDPLGAEKLVCCAYICVDQGALKQGGIPPQIGGPGVQPARPANPIDNFYRMRGTAKCADSDSVEGCCAKALLPQVGVREKICGKLTPVLNPKDPRMKEGPCCTKKDGTHNDQVDPPINGVLPPNDTIDQCISKCEATLAIGLADCIKNNPTPTGLLACELQVRVDFYGCMSKCIGKI